MSTSGKRITSSRINGQKSHGPIDTSSTRFNAMKHGLLAVGITELDDAEGYRTILRDLIREKNPVGILESQLVEAAALDIVRWTRARRLEAEYITEVLNPPQHEKDPLGDFDLEIRGRILDPGIPAAIRPGIVQCLVNTYQRYEGYFANRLFRTLHELERLQRMRQGECLPAPTAVDVTVRAETGTLDSVPVAPETAKVLAIDGEDMPSPATANVIPADTGIVASAAAESEQQSVLPADGEDGTEESAPSAWSPKAPSRPIWNER